MKTVLTMLALACAFTACADDPPPPVEPEPIAPANAPSVTRPSAQKSEPTPEQVPIPEDFEEQAEKEVSTDNLNAQLDALEQEIQQDSL